MSQRLAQPFGIGVACHDDRNHPRAIGLSTKTGGFAWISLLKQLDSEQADVVWFKESSHYQSSKWKEINMAESIQRKLDRIRPPRVQITYEVETGGAEIKKELPFVVGIMADLSGKPEVPLPLIKERKFVEIDRDNFNGVMASIEPRLALRVKNRLLEDEDSWMNVELKFRHIDDFHPAQLLKQVEPLRKLYEARVRLTDLLAKLDGNDDLEKLLQEIVSNTDGLEEIRSKVETQADLEPQPDEAV